MIEEEDDAWNDLGLNDDDLQRLLDDPVLQQSNTSLRIGEQHTGFDVNAGDTYIYPSNLPCRSYQLSITKAALFHNTLVVLPTGLGKTFIAAVVMYNLYRWYPMGKVIFMAPTRPLVAQQIEACKKIMPFPQKDTVELTGKIQQSKRMELWRQKRVFFATPQVVQSDAVDGQSNVFPFDHIKLIVVDEAHRAKGRYAYTEVVRNIWLHNRFFRVLALSATPGRTMEDVAEVVRNLYISHLEVRWENSIDVLPFVYHRNMKTIVIPLGEDIKHVRNELLEIVDPYLRQLIDAGVLSGSLSSIHRNFLLYEQKRFREHTLQHQHPQQSMINSNFSICISLYHALELLERHGLRVFLNNFEPTDGRPNFVLTLNRALRDLVEGLHQKLGPNPFDVSAHAMTNGKIAEMPRDLDFGHPKFEHARTCLIKHFDENPDSRAIVFCEYRESVMLMHRLLLQHAPLLKPRCFVGQGGTGTLRALTQKQQVQIMQDFRSGKSNILIATSVAEEGIDVGEVDLIICFDISNANPTRFIQRIGRTGRKRHGKVLMLVTEGREQQLLQEVLKNKDQINKKLLNSSVVKTSLFKYAPRLVPTQLSPQCVQTYMKPPSEDNDGGDEKDGKSKVKQKATKKTSAQSNAKKHTEAPIKGSQDLRKFFKQTKANLCEQEMSAIATQPIGANTQKSMKESIGGECEEVFKELELPEICIAAMPAAPPPFDAKELREINKFLRSTTDIIPASQRTDDFLTQIKSNVLSTETKLLMLKLNADFVRQSYESMKVLSALGLEKEQDSMSKEEKEVREAYEILVQLFEGKEAIEDFLDDYELQQEREKQLRNAAVFEQNELTDMSDEEFQNCFDKIFDGFEDRGVCCDNFDYIQRELQKTQRYQEIMTAAAKQKQQEEQQGNKVKYAASSMVYNTIELSADEDEYAEDIFNDKTNFNNTDSKYCSQWEEFVKRELPHKSTPITKAFQRHTDKMQTSAHLQERLEKEERQESAFIDVADDDDKVDADLVCAVKQLEEAMNRSSTSAIEAAEESLQNSAVKPDSNGTPSDVDLLANQHEKHTENKSRSGSSIGKTLANEITSTEHTKVDDPLLSELDFDMDAFLEPFPEEHLYSTTAATTSTAVATAAVTTTSTPLLQRPSCKMSNIFNGINNNCFETAAALLVAATSTPRTSKQTAKNFGSPKVAVELQKTPTKVTTKPLTLASKLSLKCNAKDDFKNPNAQNGAIIKSSTFATSSETSPKRNQLISSSSNATTKYERSPSVFDMYKRKMSKSCKLQKAFSNTSTVNEESIVQQQNKSVLAADVVEDSPIVQRRKRTLKRKILHSCSSGSDGDSDKGVVEPVPKKFSGVQNARSKIDSDDEVLVTPQSRNRPNLLARKKRRRLCAFVEQEAIASGSDDDDDEEEEEYSNYLLDSVVVSSDDDEDAEDISPTQAHAMYLQSLNSPQHRKGTFKIPAPRVYNDHLDIYSQPMPIENSQYAIDSFVVDENEEKPKNSRKKSKDKTMCPLERAERILKEQRRAKRRFAKVAIVNNAKSKRIIDISSDEDN